MAANLIKQIKGKHKLNSEKLYEEERRRSKLEKGEKARAASEADRPKTPKWMKEFSVDKLIEELTAETEAKMVVELEVRRVEMAMRTEEKRLKKEAAAAAALSSPTPPPPRRVDSDSESDLELLEKPLVSTFISKAMGVTYSDTRVLLYQHGSATFIQKIYRGRVQRREFLRNLYLSKYKKVARQLCRERRRHLAAASIAGWYLARKFQRVVIAPIENLFCSTKEYEVVRLLKQWLNLAPPEISEQQLVLSLPKAMYKYLESGDEGKQLNADGKRLLELINPRYVGNEHLYATSQCFMCGRPKKACGRMLKSLPSAVRKTSKFRKMKEDTLKHLMLDNEAVSCLPFGLMMLCFLL